MLRYIQKNAGFTLLELLVVLAIIGILAAITISYVTQSRDKGGDAGVKSNILNARPQAEFYFNGSATSTNSYVGVCNDGKNGVYKQVRAAARASGVTPQTTYVNTTASGGDTEVCHSDSTRYVVWVPLVGSTDTSISGWCIDSTNASRIVTTGLAANAYACPAS